jgi:two-component system NtrC family sensor kinase
MARLFLKHCLIHFSPHAAGLRISILILIFLCIQSINGFGQQDAVLIRPDMYEQSRQEILITDLDGWMFKQGNDPSWAAKDIDLKGWEKLKPTQLHAGLANDEKRVEGWFRLKLKLADAFGKDQLSFQASRWAAMDVYVDGVHIASFGNTGEGNSFKEHRSITINPVNANLTASREHVIAIHLVDYLSIIPFNRLKTDDEGGLKTILRLTGPRYFMSNLGYIQEAIEYSMVWASVCLLLSILFWLIYFQNRQEQNLLLIALCVTAFTVNIIFVYRALSQGGVPYVEYSLLKHIANLTAGISNILVVLLVVRIFKRPVTRSVTLFLTFYAILFVMVLLLFGTRFQFLFALILYGVCIYYVVSSWRNLKGAQWAVVVGLLGTLAFTIIYMINYSIYNRVLFPYALFYATGVYLSFPISLLLYVAMRFREIIAEVKLNAQQVLKLSEEKKEQALNQQRILEEEVAAQTIELRNSLDHLKATQAQLIQSEKMASLGELTAGIAHEIQNPLNFVNNFSEVNKDLLEEVKNQKSKVKNEELDDLLEDILQNNEKILQHGKRADAIVKGMLQHSRTSSGVKEPTDINALCEEYLRLAYHGLCAKDKTFKSDYTFTPDPSLGKVNVVSQDIGRVILNLINNAFYAVHEKKKQLGNGYEPKVTVSTRPGNVSEKQPISQLANSLIISVQDNGNGIPKKLLDKIFQPFFTTKPTGEGTGLGLSLSYDIVKAHGGELNVGTKEGEGSVFMITIPNHS